MLGWINPREGDVPSHIDSSPIELGFLDALRKLDAALLQLEQK
jgi:hypothetical protein